MITISISTIITIYVPYHVVFIIAKMTDILTSPCMTKNKSYLRITSLLIKGSRLYSLIDAEIPTKTKAFKNCYANSAPSTLARMKGQGARKSNLLLRFLLHC